MLDYALLGHPWALETAWALSVILNLVALSDYRSSLKRAREDERHEEAAEAREAQCDS